MLLAQNLWFTAACILTCELRREGIDTVGGSLDCSLLGCDSRLQPCGSFRVIGQRR